VLELWFVLKLQSPTFPSVAFRRPLVQVNLPSAVGIRSRVFVELPVKIFVGKSPCPCAAADLDYRQFGEYILIQDYTVPSGKIIPVFNFESKLRRNVELANQPRIRHFCPQRGWFALLAGISGSLGVSGAGRSKRR
jgi:hypothetical protein